MQDLQVERGLGEANNGVLRIAQSLISAGDSWGSITPDALKRGLGGRETAVIMLAFEWAKLGHHVEIFAPVKEYQCYKDPSGGMVEFIDYLASKAMLTRIQRDVLILWDDTTPLDWEVRPMHKAILVGMQCAHLGLPDEHAPLIDRVVCLSNWAATFLHDFLEGLVPEDKFSVVPNGIDLGRYPDPVPVTYRKSDGRYVYSSSPDRGLIHLLRMWPQMVEELGAKELLIGYGASRWIDSAKWLHNAQGDMAMEMRELMQTLPGVVDLGLIGQDVLAKLQSEMVMLAYPCDTLSPTETGCITVVEAMAAGAPVVTTKCDCLESEYKDHALLVDLPLDYEKYLGALESVLLEPDLYHSLQQRGHELAQERTWEKTSQAWLQKLNLCLQSSQKDPSERSIAIPA